MDLTSTILKDNNKGSHTVWFIIPSPDLGLVTFSSSPSPFPQVLMESMDIYEEKAFWTKCIYDGRAVSPETAMKFTVMFSFMLEILMKIVSM